MSLTSSDASSRARAARRRRRSRSASSSSSRTVLGRWARRASSSARIFALRASAAAARSSSSEPRAETEARSESCASCPRGSVWACALGEEGQPRRVLDASPGRKTHRHVAQVRLCHDHRGNLGGGFPRRDCSWRAPTGGRRAGERRGDGRRNLRLPDALRLGVSEERLVDLRPRPRPDNARR